MKRVLFFSLLVFAVAFSYGQNFKGGLRIGFNASQISGDDLSGFHKFGAIAGGYVNAAISPNGKWKIQPEINFSMKGSSSYLIADRNGYVHGKKYVLTLLYIDVPVLFKWNAWRGLDLLFGPSFNILCFAQEKDGNGVMPGRPPFRWGELSGVIGAEYLFKEHYGLSLRWSLSCIPVRVPNWVINRPIKKQFNDLISFSFYYQF